MPIVRKLTQEEIDALAEEAMSLRKKVAAFYDELLQDCVDGDEVELELEAHERRLTVISRLKNAALRRSPAVRVVFRRTRDPMLLRFRVYPQPHTSADAFSIADQYAPEDEEQPPFDYNAFDRPPRYQSGYGRQPAHRPRSDSGGIARFSQRGGYGRPKPRRRW